MRAPPGGCRYNDACQQDFVALSFKIQPTECSSSHRVFASVRFIRSGLISVNISCLHYPQCSFPSEGCVVNCGHRLRTELDAELKHGTYLFQVNCCGATGLRAQTPLEQFLNPPSRKYIKHISVGEF